MGRSQGDQHLGERLQPCPGLMSIYCSRSSTLVRKSLHSSHTVPSCGGRERTHTNTLLIQHARTHARAYTHNTLGIGAEAAG